MCFAKSDAVPSMILQIGVVQIGGSPPLFLGSLSEENLSDLWYHKRR